VSFLNDLNRPLDAIKVNTSRVRQRDFNEVQLESYSLHQHFLWSAFLKEFYLQEGMFNSIVGPSSYGLKFKEDQNRKKCYKIRFFSDHVQTSIFVWDIFQRIQKTEMIELTQWVFELIT